MGMTCQVSGCDKPHKAKGLCQTHYFRQWKRGSVDSQNTLYWRGERYETLKALAEHIATLDEDDCIEWPGKLDDGRGRVSINRVKQYAYNYVLTLREPRPDGLNALHRCGNSKCVNGNHLYWGDQTDNVADARAMGRHWTPGVGILPPLPDQ